MFIETKFKSNYYLKRLGKGTYNVQTPKFQLKNHWTARTTDVIVAVPHKSGTTWAQQICQQLRTGGTTNVNFNQDLLCATPWLERQLSEFFAPMNDKAIPADPAAGPGAVDMNADHAESHIRVFKSHLPMRALKGIDCKIIYFYRHDVDVVYSGYRFFCEQILELTNVKPHQYATIVIMQGLFERSLNNLCSFWERRNDPNIGFFFYDDVKEDHRGSVIRFAELMGIEPKSELIDKVVEQSTVKFMSADDHHLRFDGFTVISNVKRAVGLDYSYWPEVSGQPPRGELPTLKVQKGGGLGSKDKKKAEPGRDEVEACFKIAWNRIVLPRTGFADMESMRSAWKAERSKKM